MPLLSTLAFIANHPLNNGRKAQALSRYFKWQIGSRLLPGRIIHDWINGSRIIVESGETGSTGNLYCHLHDFEDMAYLLHVLQPDDLFVDIGANVGSYTILACAAKGAKGMCFEPVPSTYARLMDNLRINNLCERVKALNIGLADRESELLFTSGEDTTNHIVDEADRRAAPVVRVQVLPLDPLLSDATPAMLKIDVEGYETPVLHGARDTLRKHGLHSVIMELNGSGRRYGFGDREIIDYMSNFGFSTFSYDPFSRQLKTLRGDARPVGNTLFVRNELDIQARLRQASKISIGGLWI